MCKIEILDKTDNCPLCRHVLEQDGKEGRVMYPDARIVTRKYRMFENIFLFVSIVLWCILAAINYTTNPEFMWSFPVGLAFIYANVMVRLTILGRQTYMTKILWSILIGLACLIEADVLTGSHGWGFNFALPSAVLLWDIALLLLMLFINRRNWQSYMIDQLTALVACGIMLILMWCGKITYLNYAVAVQMFTVFLFLGTVIIGDRKARSELKRRFHM